MPKVTQTLVVASSEGRKTALRQLLSKAYDPTEWVHQNQRPDLLQAMLQQVHRHNARPCSQSQ